MIKNYIATEGQSWDTSTALIRRVFRACIDHGRRARGSDGPDLFEAYRFDMIHIQGALTEILAGCLARGCTRWKIF